ncbi:hypothetical protein [Rubrivirga sp.]|uniref:hypothetical protein n=1 Tax=Rubrivirga sp. TaxID=1885344 RepID=UPI003C71707B
MRALLLLLFALPAQANMASPISPGTPAGEPAADLEGLRIARERLVLDLTRIGAADYATIEAEYRIVNAGLARVLPLEFLALGSDLEVAQVWLNERPVEAERVDSLAVPPSWTVVSQTPALDGSAYDYQVSDGFGAPSGLRFQVAIPAGQHSIRVRYRARPGTYDDGSHPNKVYQLAYSLAPARRWAGFGQLDLEVRVPAGWDVATSLPLRREGDVLIGRFGGVPGDVLAISARAPASPLRGPVRASSYLAWLVVVGLMGLIAGRLAGQAGKRLWAALPGAIFGGLIAAVVFVILQLVALDLGSSSAGYGSAITVMMGGPLAFVLGIGAAQLVAAWAHRRWRPATV